MSSFGSNFDPDSPEFRRLVRASKEHFTMQEEKGRQMTLTGEPVQKFKGFGRFSALPPEIPTMNELAITQYLDKQKIPYTRHYKVGKDFPEYGEHPNIEFDIYIPSKQIAIEVSPKFHSEARILKYINNPKTKGDAKKNLARVARNDRLKRQISREHGIELIEIDPSDDINKFALRLNYKLVPALRTAGLHAPNLYIEKAQLYKKMGLMKRVKS